MSSGKISKILYIIGLPLLLSACSDKSRSPLEKNLSIRGISYCDEVNQIVDAALYRHLTKSEADRHQLYNTAMYMLANQGLQILPYEFYNDFLSLIEKLQNQNDEFSSENLKDCRDIAQIHNYFYKLTERVGGTFPDERVFFWYFLSNFIGQLDHMSAYILPIGEAGSPPHEFGLRLDLDLAGKFNHVQTEAKVLAVAQPSQLQVGDRIVAVGSDYLDKLAEANELSELASREIYSIRELTENKLGGLLQDLFLMGPDAEMTVSYIPKDGEDEDVKTIKLSGNPAHGLVERKPLVQGELRGNIAYIRLFEFGSGASIEFSNKLHALKQEWLWKQDKDTKNKFSIVLDLRFNPGGSLYELEQILGFFLPSGQVGVMRERKISANLEYEDSKIYSVSTGITFDDPLIVLANNRSGSASDALTQILMETGRAYFVGQPTFGKGIAQVTFDLGWMSKLGGAVRITTSRLYGPSGSSSQNVGVMPQLSVVDPLVADLLEKCKNDSSCKIQYMKDFSDDLEIAGDSIEALDKSKIPQPVTSTHFDSRQANLALTKIQDEVFDSDPQIDIQYKVAEMLLNSLSEEEAEE